MQPNVQSRCCQSAFLAAAPVLWAAPFEFERRSERNQIHSQRKQLESTGRFNAVSVSKMVSKVLSGKEAAADVRANLKKEVEGIKVSDM